MSNPCTARMFNRGRDGRSHRGLAERPERDPGFIGAAVPAAKSLRKQMAQPGRSGALAAKSTVHQTVPPVGARVAHGVVPCATLARTCALPSART